MQSYAKVYLEAFSLDKTDFIGCGVCEKKSTEFHHIISRGKFKGGLNLLENIFPICRTCHLDYGDKTEFMVLLLQINRRRLQIATIDFDDRFFEFYINKYTAKQELKI